MKCLEGQLSHPETPSQRPDTSTDTAEGDDQPTVRARPVLQKQSRLAASEVRDMLARRVAGATIAELATQFEIHRTTVMAHLKRNSPRRSASR
jgi:hypothetical protein